MRTLLVGALALTLAACQDAAPTGEAPAAPATAAPATAAPATAAPATAPTTAASAPLALLAFDPATVDGGKVATQVPRGWIVDENPVMKGRRRPPGIGDEDPTSFSIYAGTVENQNLDFWRNQDRYRVLLDEALPDGELLIVRAKDGPRVMLQMVRHPGGQGAFIRCAVTLAGRFAADLPGFQKACVEAKLTAP
ncbi:MAG: hypothetical protein H6706_20605 [Myxococcales bacterium]|nr:hypothetical protein [Myxococcales bacterium]